MTVDEVKSKMNSELTAFRREKAKIKNNVGTGKGKRKIKK